MLGVPLGTQGGGGGGGRCHGSIGRGQFARRPEAARGSPRPPSDTVQERDARVEDIHNDKENKRDYKNLMT